MMLIDVADCGLDNGLNFRYTHASRGMDFADAGKKIGRSEKTARRACEKIELILSGGKDFFNKKKPSQIREDAKQIKKALEA